MAMVSQGSGDKIPPNSTLKFEIELLSWSGEDVSDLQDGSVMKSILCEGTGYRKPVLGTSVTVNLIGRLKDSGVGSGQARTSEI